MATRVDLRETSQRPIERDAVIIPVAHDRDQAVLRDDPVLETARVRVEIIADGRDLLARAEAWNRLAGASLVANPVYDISFLRSLFTHLPELARGVRFILIWRDDGGSTSRLIGLFGIESSRFRWVFPATVTLTWRHIYTFFGPPLVCATHWREAFEGYFGWLATQSRFHLMRFVPADGRFFDAVTQTLAGRGYRHCLTERFERAALDTPDSAAEYLQQHLPRKRRKEFRRLRSRLAETGQLVSEFKDTADGLDEWIDQYVRLEAQSWKGARGTAIASEERWRAFFGDVLTEAFAHGKGLFWRLTLDGAPIAVTFGLMEGRQAWLLKITHDAAFDRYSPGTLLVLDVMETLAGHETIQNVDSCATPNHPMINRLWHERIAMGDILIDLAPCKPRWKFSTLRAAERARHRAIEILKRIYPKFRTGGPK